MDPTLMLYVKEDEDVEKENKIENTKGVGREREREYETKHNVTVFKQLKPICYI